MAEAFSFFQDKKNPKVDSMVGQNLEGMGQFLEGLSGPRQPAPVL
jgi:hypothetical protein